MANDFTITFPKAQVDSLIAQMRQAEKKLGKSTKQSTEWAGRLLCESMAGATNKSKTKRPIVKNPHEDTGKDPRRGLIGVMKYVQNRAAYKHEGAKRGSNVYGNRWFDPISKGGEFGQEIKYLPNGEVLLKLSHGNWKKFTREELKANAAYWSKGAENHPKTKIGRSGLAKKVWRWCMGHTRVGGSGTVMGMPHLAVIRWTGADRSTLEMTSRLRYAMDALKNGGSEINSIMGKAADSMRYRIGLKLDEIAKGIAK
jgi:hypothetical protein